MAKTPKPLQWGSRLVGVHCSTQGGLETAIERGDALGCTAMQIFSKNNKRWLAPPLDNKEIDAFQGTWKLSRIQLIFAHAGYLINLASPDAKTTERSMESMRTELIRAENLDLPFIILHPGSHKGEGETVAIRRVADRLNILFEESVFSKTRILLEGTAGQGNSIGHRFEHLRDILSGVRDIDRIGICLDTAHLFAAGYDFRTPKTYAAMWSDFDRIVGMRWLGALHLNDSTHALDSHVDRHTHIGEGKIGARAFGLIMRDAQLAHLPMVCETPKGKTDALDRKNLVKLHRMLPKD
jgi:deoxyribonuclease IV